MDSDTDKSVGSFNQTSTTQFMRFMWIAFNNINMYGTSHPLAKKGVDSYSVFLKEALKGTSPITLHIEGDHLLCEKWRTDKGVNVKRLVERFKSSGINSISFFKDIRSTDITEILKILADAKNFQKVEKIIEAIKINNVRGITINSFVYKRILADDKEEENQLGKEDTDASSDKIEKDQFTKLTKNLFAKFFDQGVKEPLSLLDQLKILRDRIRTESGTSETLPSSEELLNAIMSLKAGKFEETQTASETEETTKPGKEILFELELLTYELIIRFVQESFQSKTLSAKKLGNLVKNLLPDISDLKMILSQMKDVLMSNGMTLQEYLQFLQELSVELEQGGIIDLLKKTEGDIGVSTNEITEDLKKNPHISAQLIFLTLKILSVQGINRDQIISMLSQNLELTIRKKTLENLRNKEVKNTGEIRENLSYVKNSLLQQLEKEGVSEDILKDVKENLSQRSNLLLGQLWSEWTIDKVSSKKELSDVEQIENLAKIVRQNNESKNFMNSLLFVLEEKGYNRELLDNLIKKITAATPEQEADKKKSPKLPKEILNLRETKKYLQFEIYRNLRYNTSFSCISLSITQVNIDSLSRKPETAELAEIIQVLAKILTHSIRNLDFIGSLGSITNNYLFIIMTMTNKIGCKRVQDRISSLLKEISIKTNGSLLVPTIFISSFTFDKNETPDIKSFLRKAKANHRKKMKLFEINK